MKLHDILSNPQDALTYVERFVNDGSPSGYSVVHSTSDETSPFNLNPWFTPYVCISQKNNFISFGDIPEFDELNLSSNQNWILVHPDMYKNDFFKNSSFNLIRFEHLKVSPTSSGRTVQLLNHKNRDYVKLHYDGILGRVHRGLSFKKAVAGPELSQYILRNIANLDNKISLFPETGARVLVNRKLNEDNEWGMTWRSGVPYFQNKEKIAFILPIYALFSYDRLASYESKLLLQLIDLQNVDPIEYVIEKLVYQIIDCYFELILNLGIQPEWNAQNLLIGFDKDLEPIKFIMRDIESIDKDLTMMKLLNINETFQSFPHKCIFKDQYNYQIKHSFMYCNVPL
jgi:hypothetical protein